MPRKQREPIQVKVVPVEATEAEIARVWAEVTRVLASVQVDSDRGEGQG